MVSPVPLCTVIRLRYGNTVKVLSTNLGTKLDCSEKVAEEAPACLCSAAEKDCVSVKAHLV